MKKSFQKFALMTASLLMAVSTIPALPTKAAIVNGNHKKYSYSELTNDLKELQKKYPGICQVNVIGKSADGRKIYELVIGNPNAKRELGVIANLHAREYMTTPLVMKQAEFYLDNYNNSLQGAKVSNVLDKVSIHIIPSCNPDGTAISQFGFSSIHKKKLRRALRHMGGSSTRWKANARGVDLNRNWAIAHRTKGHRGAMGFSGNHAASEPEVKALVRWTNSLKKKGKLKGFVSYHSTGSILYGRVAGQATGKVKKQTRSMSNTAKSLTGYHLMPTQSIASSRGCSREYYLYKRKIPCITLEVGHGAAPLSASEFNGIWGRNKYVILREAMLFD